MKNTNKPKNITCRIVNTGVVMHINTINEIVFPGYFKIDACNVTAADGLPDAIDGTCLSAYLEVSDTNHNPDNLNSAATGQTLFYTNADGINAAYYRSGINRDGMVEWGAWVDLGAAKTSDIQDGTITAQKLSSDVLTKIQESANGAWWTSGPNAVTLNINKNDGTVGWQTLPAATEEKAGVMTSQDRKTIAGIDAAIAEGEKRALRRLFIAAGAEYNDSGADKTKTAPWGETVTHKAGHYYLNGLGDITEEQMMAIYNAPHNALYPAAYTNMTTRTLLWYNGTRSSVACPISHNGIFFSNANLETIGTGTLNSDSLYYDNKVGELADYFRGCTNLKHINITFEIAYIKKMTRMFDGCVSLITTRLNKLPCNVSLGDSPNISKGSILHAIVNAQPTVAITVTLHHDAYTRLADDAEIVAALEAQPLISLVSA